MTFQGHDVRNPREVLEVINEANEEIVKHCQLIAQLQAINTDLLNRIRLLEERLMVN